MGLKRTRISPHAIRRINAQRAGHARTTVADECRALEETILRYTPDLLLDDDFDVYEDFARFVNEGAPF